MNPGILSHQGWKKNPAYPEPSQTSKNELSAKVVNGLELLTIFAKSSMLDARLDSDYASGLATAAYELKHIEWIFQDTYSDYASGLATAAYELKHTEYFKTCNSIIYWKHCT